MSTDDEWKEPEPAPAPAPEPPTAEPVLEPPLEPLGAAEPVTSSTDDLREAVGVSRLDEKAARKAEKEAAKEAGKELIRQQKEAKDKAKAEARAARRRELGEDDAPADGEDDADGEPKKRGRTGLVIAGALVVGGLIATFVLLGQSNAERYLFTCGEKRIVAQRGRSFPPWGASSLGGAEWKAIPIAPGVECESRETDDPDELTGWFLDALVEQAQAKLTAREVAEVDEAQRELDQALLLARDPDRRDQRHEIERLLGDVEYWRGSARVKEAAETLEEAAKRYDQAADKRPRHASDAAAWAEFVRRTAADLLLGPAGVPPRTVAQPGGSDGPKSDLPTGVALPVEEPEPVTMPDAAPEPPIDAGLPQGGVLL